MPKAVQTIKFNNNYPKLFGQNHAQLLMVINDLSGEILKNKFPEFIRYDSTRDDGKLYAIDKSEKYMLLLFWGNSGVPFTTLRKYNPENAEKYNNAIGDIFEIEIEEPAKGGV